MRLSWIPEYAGGNYKQAFHVEYKKQNSTEDWKKIIFQDNKMALITGLEADTVYVFRIKSVSDRTNGDNDSPLSPETSTKTKGRPNGLKKDHWLEIVSCS